MSQQILKQPLGTSGGLDIEESGGAITIDVSESLMQAGISVDLKLSIDSAALLLQWSDSTKNEALKAILKEAAALVHAMP